MCDTPQNPVNNNDPSPEEQCSKVDMLAKCMRRWVAYEDHDGHTVYAFEIVSNAVKCGHYPSAVDEIMRYLQGPPKSFVHLLRSIYSLSPATETDWQQIGQTLDTFYSRRHFNERKSTWRLGTEVQPLHVVCRRVENDIIRLKTQLDEQRHILSNLRETGLHYHKLVDSPAPGGFRRFFKKTENPTFKVMEDAKQQCFTRIYQRTRELCRYEDESIHFYHAFKLVELFHGIIERNSMAYTGFEKQRKVNYFAEKLREMTNIYTEPLEDILKVVDTNELLTLVLKQTRFSNPTHKVLCCVWHNIEKIPLDLDYEQAEGKLIPRCMGSLMLGPHVYKLVRHREAIAEDLQLTMSKNMQWKKFTLEAMQIANQSVAKNGSRT